MTPSPNHVLYISCPCTFRVHQQRHSCSLVAAFVVLDVLESSLNWFFTLITFGKKVNAVPMQTRVLFWPGKNKLARVNKMIWFLDRSRSHVCCFDSGPWVASFVRMRYDVLSLHNWDNNYLFFSRL